MYRTRRIHRKPLKMSLSTSDSKTQMTLQLWVPLICSRGTRALDTLLLRRSWNVTVCSSCSARYLEVGIYLFIYSWNHFLFPNRPRIYSTEKPWLYGSRRHFRDSRWHHITLETHADINVNRDKLCFGKIESEWCYIFIAAWIFTHISWIRCIFPSLSKYICSRIVSFTAYRKFEWSFSFQEIVYVCLGI